MGYCSVDCTNPVANIRFKSWESTYDIKVDAFKVHVSEQSVQVISLCQRLSSSDEVSYSKKDGSSWNKCEPPTKPFLLSFKFNKKQYRAYVDKQWVDTEPSAYEKFAAQYLERTCDPEKQYSGYFAVYPVREEHAELLLDFDEQSPNFTKATIFREQRIEIHELSEPIEELTTAVFAEEKESGLTKKYKTPSESLAEKISAVNALIKSEIGCTTELTGVPTDKKLEELLTAESTATETDLIGVAIEVRDILLKFF